MSSGSLLLSCRFCSWHDMAAAAPADRGLAVSSVVPAPRTSASGAWTHGMHLYADDAELLPVLADYLVQGWEQGGTAIVLATPGHRAALVSLLAAGGSGPDVTAGRFIQLDAEATLRLIMHNGVPDTFLFQETLGALVRSHAEGQPLLVFGELVDVLWREGNVAGAVRLEQLWSRLQQEVPFTLLCSYFAEHVDSDGQDALGRLHDHVMS